MASQYEKRKRKQKISDEEVAKLSDEKEEIVPNYDRTAYDVIFDEQKREYVRVSVVYDLNTGAAKVNTIEKLSENQPVSIKKMVELFTRKVLNLPVK